jgi:battenin
MKFMIPLGVTYFAQYLISQGLSEFSVFDCDHGFGLDVKSQYRWYQVLSQLGIFITRSSASFCQLPAVLLFSLPFLQVCFFGGVTIFYHSFWAHLFCSGNLKLRDFFVFSL